MTFIWFWTSLKPTEQASLLSPPVVQITIGKCRGKKRKNKPFKNYFRNTTGLFVVMQRPNSIEICGESSNRKNTLARDDARNHSSRQISTLLCQTVTRKIEQVLSGIFASASHAAHRCLKLPCSGHPHQTHVLQHTTPRTAGQRQEGRQQRNWLARLTVQLQAWWCEQRCPVHRLVP